MLFCERRLFRGRFLCCDTARARARDSSLPARWYRAALMTTAASSNVPNVIRRVATASRCFAISKIADEVCLPANDVIHGPQFPSPGFRNVDHTEELGTPARIVCTIQYLVGETTALYEAIFIIPASIATLNRNCRGAVCMRHRGANRCLSLCRRARRLWKDLAEFLDAICRTLHYCRTIFCNLQIDILINGYTKTSCLSLLSEVRVKAQISTVKSRNVLISINWKDLYF